MTTKWCRARKKNRGEKARCASEVAAAPGFYSEGRCLKRARERARAEAHLVVLIRRHGYEIRFWENVRPEGAVRQLEDVVGPHDVEAGLILVHGVEYGLQHTVGDTRVTRSARTSL